MGGPIAPLYDRPGSITSASGPLTATTSISTSSSSDPNNDWDGSASTTITMDYGVMRGNSLAAVSGTCSCELYATSRSIGFFSDGLTVSSLTLAPSTAVTFSGFLTLDATVTLPGGPNNNSSTYAGARIGFVDAGSSQRGVTDVQIDTRQSPFNALGSHHYSLSEPFTVNTSVGSTLAVFGNLSTSAEARFFCCQSTSALAEIDASHTARLVLTSWTPGVAFTTASGASYAPVSSVPEPSTWLLLRTGVVRLLLWRRTHGV